ncbi:Right handed beta helix region [Amycolatopsis xylanica]|uniref:Right handed beta helix region n=1 Tax=Amycolatopsis xylanica TaxID=589385 RepID=A0A1H3P956_9PSEU|nr:right-handed parallel beta-helix repeat-containing protein [Amycolatopsis xylanica]SDY97601.1 Right handed beta helix region [Amycolatopsis xylanica]
MSKLGRLLLAGVTGLVTFASPASAGGQTTLYAAPSGSGTACTQAAPCDLEGARARASALTDGQSGDIVVYLRGGTYRLTKPLKLGPGDSGRNGFTVAYRAFPGETPVLSGAQRVTGFTLHDAAKNIYKASVPAGTDTRQLFVNGKRAERARTALDATKFTTTSTGFTTTDPAFAKFTNQSDVEIAQDNKWKHMRCPLASITASGGGSALKVQPACWDNNNTHVINRQFPFNGNGLPKLDGVTWVENAYQLLTKPGQWYLDRGAAALYYIPRAGEQMTTAEVELPTLENLLSLTGTPGHLAPVDDSDARAVYKGSWSASSGRALGDFGDGVHVTKSKGASVTFTFTGTGLDVLAETNTDQGTFDATVDGKASSGTEKGSTRLAQQVVFSVKGLAKGAHTVTLTSTSTANFLVDAFVVTPDVVAPVHDVTVSGLTFTGTTWLLPSADGYVDNQAGIQWSAKAPHDPLKTAAAVEVHRGQRVSFSGNTFTHLGGAGLAYADGTQNSAIDHNTFSDLSGSGIAVGEVDDYYLADTARMTLSDTISDNIVDTPGQDYRDAVGIWVGHSKLATVTHNEVRHAPYSGISLGWGWGYASACDLQAKQGLPTCRRGTIYSGQNKILGNRVNDVMRVLHDGGAIYTLGGQTGSEFAGNYLSLAPNNNNMVYHDEGSAYWNTHDNVISNGTGRWVGMWTPTIHDITIHDNYTDNAEVKNKGTKVTITATTVVTGGNWPAAAKAIMAAAGPR